MTDGLHGMHDDEDDESSGPPAGEELILEDGGRTSDESERFWLTNDILAIILVVSFAGMIFAAGTGVFDFDAVPEMALYAYGAVMGISVAWAFGTRAIRGWRGDP